MIPAIGLMAFGKYSTVELMTYSLYCIFALKYLTWQQDKKPMEIRLKQS